MARKKKHPEHVNHERWLVSYADFITLLFATFTALFAMSNADLEKVRQMAASVKQAFSGGSTTMPSISLDSASGHGDLVIKIMDDVGVRPKNGEGDDGRGRGPGDGQKESLSDFDPVSDVMSGTNAAFDREERQARDADTMMREMAIPSPTPTPAPPPLDPVPVVSVQVLGDPAAVPSPSPTPDSGDSALGKSEGGASVQLAQRIEQMMKDAGLDGMVQVRSEIRGTVISLGEAAFFNAGGTEVIPQSVHTLSRIVNALRDTSLKIRVEGHTDNTPVGPGHRFRDNVELSTLRAAHVMQFMIDEFAFDGSRISVAGYGEYRPVAENQTLEGRQKNRRVDIVILNEVEARSEP